MEKHSTTIGSALRNAIPGRSGFDTLVVGAGFAGSVLAERLASVCGQRVLVVDKRPHIGGNAYDRHDDAGILIHPYGPHIFHTNSADIFEYLSQFTEWRPTSIASSPASTASSCRCRSTSTPSTASTG